MSYFIVTWTNAYGGRSEFHYGNREVAEAVAAKFREGWRKDARVEDAR